jgi:hypothetical protein
MALYVLDRSFVTDLSCINSSVSLDCPIVNPVSLFQSDDKPKDLEKFQVIGK